MNDLQRRLARPVSSARILLSSTSMYAIPPDVRSDETPRVTGLVCPDCGGSLEVQAEGHARRLSFACRVGHRFALGELLVAKEEQLEEKLWAAAAALDEL